jgi:hypothetical protein
MNRSTIRCLGLVCLGAVISFTEVRSAPPPPKVLETQVSVGDSAIRQAEFGTVLDFLCRKGQCNVTIDTAAFKGRGVKSVSQRLIVLPKLRAVPVGLVLEMAARQVDGTITWDHGQLTITPGKSRDLSAFLAPPPPPLNQQLAKPAKIDRPIVNAHLKDILEFLSDKYDLNILLDEWAFNGAGVKDVGDTLCSLPADTFPIKEWLDKLAKKVDGHVIVGKEVILIVPLKRDHSAAPVIPRQSVAVTMRR